MSTGGDQRVSKALDAVESSLRALRAGDDVEVFVRVTRRFRLELEEGRARVMHGVEEGTAVRHRAATGRLHFGAASGAGAGAAMRASVLARANRASDALEDGPPWGRGGPWIDPGAGVELGSVEEAEAWLREACGRRSVGRALLDAAVSVEALGSGDGLRACRVRGVVWSRAVHGALVRSAVARGLGALDPADWDEPEAVPLASADLRSGLDAIALLPGAVGVLAPALVAAVHGSGDGLPVGPGWICEDDPADPEAPGGGSFDDTGCPSVRKPLADGHRVLGAPRGPGCRRRPSFRSPPVDRAANLRFRSSGTWDGCGLLARAVRLLGHSGAHWWVALEAAPMGHGELAGPWTQWVVAAPPDRWVRACRAAVGRVARAPEGVTTPTLVFEGLGPTPLPT